MTIVRPLLLAAAVAWLSVIAVPLSAKQPFAAAKPLSETVAPSADGTVKRFSTQIYADCLGSSCVASFGSKKDRVRSVETLTCITSATMASIAAAVSLAEVPNVYDIFIAPSSSIPAPDGEVYSVFTWTQRFQVPKGTPLTVSISSSGDATLRDLRHKGND